MAEHGSTGKDRVKLMSEFMELGKTMGYSGTELATFAQQQAETVLNAEREERAAARDLRKAELEAQTEKEKIQAQTEKEKIEMEKEKIEAQREKERMQAENERLQIVEQTKREEIKEAETTKRIEVETQIKTGDTRGSGHRSHQYAPRPKLPMFNDGVDSIDTFLFRFENHARMVNWDPNEWSYILSAMLEGSALAIYRDLQTTPGVLPYERLKAALLAQYACTPESARNKFRQCRPEQGRPAEVFAGELKRSFNYWLEAKQVKSYDDLKDLCLQEQMMEALSKDVQVFIAEKKPEKFQDMVDLMETYRTVHPGKTLARKTEKLVLAGASQAQRDTGSFRKSKRREHYTKPESPGERERKRPRIDPAQKKSAMKDKTCYSCGEKGHFFHHCPKNKDTKGIRKYVAAVAKRSPSDSLSSSSNSESESEEPARTLCSISQNCVGELKFDTGRTNGEKCSVLRDTGANACGVRKRLVRNDQYTGKSLACISFGGRKERFDLADIQVESEYFSGTLRCCVLKDPVADLIIGNVPGLTKEGERRTNKIKVAAQVVTRARARHVVPQTTLAESITTLDVPRAELIRLQRADATLIECHAAAERGPDGETKDKDKHIKFYYEQSVLLREFATPQGIWRQIAVPQTLRASVLAMAHDTPLAGHCGARRTLVRLREKFHWPGVTVDVAKYVASCDPCQKAAPKGRTPPVPLAQEIP